MSDTPYRQLSGEPSRVTAMADRYAEIGHAIARSVATLNRILDGEGQKSKAVDAIQENAKGVTRDIGKAQERYSQTATALQTYGSALQTAHDDASAAIAAIATAQGDVDDAQTAYDNLENPTEPPTDPTANQTALTTAHTTLGEKQTALNNAHDLWWAAKNAKDSAARTAAGQIDDIVNGKVGDKLNDSWWDNISSVLDVIKVICEWAAFLSIFLSWVPVLGAILVGLAILGALISLIDSIVKFSRGEGSFGDIVFAAVGVVLAAFGGKIVSYLAKLGKFSSLGKLASLKKGSEGFLNSKGFKAVAGITKRDVKSELKALSSLKGASKEIFQNPFALKLGTGGNAWSRFLSGAQTGGKEFLTKPFGLQSFSSNFGNLTTGAKIGVIALDVRTGLSKIQSGLKPFGIDVTIEPESVLQSGINNLTGAPTR